MKRGDRFVQWVIQRRDSRRRVVVISRSWRWRRARSAAICVEMFDPLCRGECSENAVLCRQDTAERERARERETERKRKEAVFARSWTRESADFWSDTTVGGKVM